MNSTLLNQLAMPENLLAAWRVVRGNVPQKRRQRAAGADGVTLAEFEQELAANLAALRNQLLNGRYAPAPPTRIEIPKRDGSRRVIGVLTVADRVVQRAAHQILEPLFEPSFLDCSFGFRPGRSVEQALLYAAQRRHDGRGWVVDGDIANCFDSLDHHLLMTFLSQRITERPLLDLLHQWLAAGIIPAGLPSPEDDLPPYWWRVVKNSTQTGFDWTLEALMAQSGHLAGSYTPYSTWPEAGYPSALEHPHEVEPFNLRREALKRVAVGGIALGLSGLKSAAGLAARNLHGALSTPHGRQLLRKGALTTGAAAGAATLAAAGALTLYQRRAGSRFGILQGSPLSPLLANLYLHPFDLSMVEQAHCLVRYADDWLILCPDARATEAAYDDAIRALERLKLRLNPVKTRLLRPTEPAYFLGGQIRGYPQ